MSTQDNGGAAFPAQPILHMPGGATMMTTQGGMTLRDYFAAKALQGFAGLKQAPTYKDEYEMLASTAYRMADAMLEARK